MPKLRLTQTMRARLVSLADKLVRLPVEEKIVADLYALVAPGVKQLVETKYPRKDMLVLKKYGKTHDHYNARLNLTAGGVVEFRFNPDDAPLAADSYPIFGADDALTEAFENWRLATAALKKARDAKLADYRSLIRFSRNLEDVTDIWPEAEQIRPTAACNALVALSPDALARIKADSASRMAVAA